MYLAITLMFPAIPLVLGSSWTFVPVVALVLLLLVRAVIEERLLRRDLPDYEKYVRDTRWRIIPGVW